LITANNENPSAAKHAIIMKNPATTGISMTKPMNTIPIAISAREVNIVYMILY